MQVGLSTVSQTALWVFLFFFVNMLSLLILLLPSSQVSSSSLASKHSFWLAISSTPLYLWGIAHQDCFCALFRGICRAPATSKIELFATFLNGFQSLTNVTKNYILDVMGVLDPSLLLRIKILFQNIDT